MYLSQLNNHPVILALSNPTEHMSPPRQPFSSPMFNVVIVLVEFSKITC